MADRKQLEDALISAHEAGDTEAAELFAQEIRSLSAPAKPVTSRTPIRFAGVKDADVSEGNTFENWAKSGWDLKRDAGLIGRAGLNAVAALPNMAADFGVAVRNLVAGESTELPSSMWKRGLTDMGLPEPEGVREKGSMLLGEIAMGGRLPAPEAANKAPALFNPKNTVKAQTLKQSQEAGYVVPPATTNPSTMNKVIESLGGKVGTAQDAAIKNSVITNQLANQSLGRPLGAEFTEGVLPNLRARAAEAYKPVREIGTIRLDTAYEGAIDDTLKQFNKVAQQFPKLAKTDLIDTISSLKTKSVDSDVAVDAIAMLRANADEAYAAGEKQAGSAYKATAKALEDAIERSLQRRGKDAAKTLTNFRDARQLIAKSYSVEKALNQGSGNVSARKLATQLDKGAPLSGDLKTAARFGQTFPKAAADVLDSGSVRNTDVILGGGSAALSGSPWPLLYPFSRQAARDFLLSPAGQKMAQPSSMESSPRTAMGILYGANGLLSQ